MMMRKKVFVSQLLIFLFFFAFFSFAEEKAFEAKTRRQENNFWETFWNFFLPHLEKRNILFEKQTQYFFVTVEEDHNAFRHMVFNPQKGSQGIWNPKAPDELISNYSRYTSIFLALINKAPKRVLFIGLGVGILPRFVRQNFPDTIIDVVEIDGEIPAIAETYFGFKKDNKINIHIADGRYFINQNKEKYDIIFIDAYNSECIPFQLTTEEFYSRIKASLLPDGIVTANLANLDNPNFIASEIKTVISVFPDLAVFITANKTNYILFSAVNRKLNTAELKKNASKIEAEKNLKLNICDMIDTRMTEDDMKKIIENVNILKDDFAPVETMR